MSGTVRNTALFALVAGLIVLSGVMQSWSSALLILNMGLVSAIMSLGVNLQWGFAGLFNVGIVGFVALGGLAAMLVSMPPTPEAWAAGGARVLAGLATGAAVIVAAALLCRRMAPSRWRGLAIALVLVGGFFLYRRVFDPGVALVEAVNPAGTGYLGGLGLPIVLSWPVGGLLAAGAVWIIGKAALGLRSDYLAIATLGIAEIILAVLKNEDWLSRGVKNVVGLPRPVPYEADPGFVAGASALGLDPVTASSLTIKLAYAGLFAVGLIVLLVLAQLALDSPWGRMMRAIRDNEVAAEAMGKDVTARHLQVFILGSAVCGIAGAMMTTLDGQLIPTSYQPLRFTFLIWVMVIVGGSGNNFGAVLGGFLIWFLWVQVEPIGLWLIGMLTAPLADGSALKAHLLASAAHMRLLTMGLILLLVLRFSPRGLIPEKQAGGAGGPGRLAVSVSAPLPVIRRIDGARATIPAESPAFGQPAPKTPHSALTIVASKTRCAACRPSDRKGPIMWERIARFARDETGAAATDWIVLTAGVTLLGLSAVTVVEMTITEHAGDRVESVVVSGGD